MQPTTEQPEHAPIACAKCGETWSPVEWPELPAVGRYCAGRDGWIELRTCVCGSTLAKNPSDALRDPRQGEPHSN